MLNATFRPLDKWPGERTRVRKSAQFRASYPATLDLLEYELDKLRARGTVIQVDNLSLADGWPRGRGGWQGVIVSFESPKGAMSFPCDRYSEWRDNLRAIALSLEALRTVDRYEVTRGNEQYRGWARLESANGHAMTTPAEAINFIASVVNADPIALAENWRTIGEAMVKRALKLPHPDLAYQTDENAKRQRHEMFLRVVQAQTLLQGGGK